MANRYVAFGYEITDGQFSVIESEKTIVQNIFGLYLNGKSFNEISTRMNDAGVSYNNDGRQWNKNIIKRIMENRRYIGEKGFPQIITSETFDMAERIRLSKFTPPTPEEKQILDFYQEGVVCSECGSNLQRYKGSKIKRGGINTYRRCSNENCIGNLNPINEKKLNLIVVGIMNELIDNYTQIKGVTQSNDAMGTEVIKLENELADEMMKITLNISRVVDRITELAEVRFENTKDYDCTAIDEKIKKVLCVHPKSETLDGKLLHNVVKRIRYAPNRTIEIELINGYKITGGEPNDAKCGLSS